LQREAADRFLASELAVLRIVAMSSDSPVPARLYLGIEERFGQERRHPLRGARRPAGAPSPSRAGTQFARCPRMNARMCIVAAFLFLTANPFGVATAGPFTDIHPEGAYPDPAPAASTDPYTGFIARVQEKLGELGFAAGPANGDFGEKTQAALGQFQLARNLPASGQLDDATLAELGVQRDSAQSTDASTGASSEPAPQPQPQQKPEG